MALEMRDSCETCGAGLDLEAEAYICSNECTFRGHRTHAMDHTCPNCGGKPVHRPRRRPRE